MPAIKTTLATAGLLALVASSATAQGVAFQPVIGSFPNGVSMSVTPSVSFDGRYVRMGIDPRFTGLNGFDTYSVPAASGGIARGMGGAAGGAGAAGGVMGFAGMNGPGDGFGGAMAPSYPYEPLDLGPAAPAYRGFQAPPEPQPQAKAKATTVPGRRGQPAGARKPKPRAGRAGAGR